MSPAHKEGTRPQGAQLSNVYQEQPHPEVQTGAVDRAAQQADQRQLNGKPCARMQIKDVLARVGDKWSMCVVGALYEGPVRFNTIKRRIGGVSQRMLTLTLRGLERDGLVTRTVYATNPPSVEYTLTDLGSTLVGPVLALVQWSEANLNAIEQARNAFAEQAAQRLQTLERASLRSD